jgi:hypothetical protein
MNATIRVLFRMIATIVVTAVALAQAPAKQLEPLPQQPSAQQQPQQLEFLRQG